MVNFCAQIIDQFYAETLNETEKVMLEDLRVASNIVQRTRDRAHMLLLSHRGWRVSQIAEVFDCHDSTVRSTLQRWQTSGLCGLRDAPGRGVKPKCQEADWQYLEALLEKGERTYTSGQRLGPSWKEFFQRKHWISCSRRQQEQG